MAVRASLGRGGNLAPTLSVEDGAARFGRPPQRTPPTMEFASRPGKARPISPKARFHPRKVLDPLVNNLEPMAGTNATTVRCATCGTEFSSTDSAEMQNHIGHDLVHVDPGG